ncbi:MAG: M50 family metallopeptidase [Chloroflexota bacterium]
MTLVAVVGLFVVLIVAHELGHFITAKLTGVKVEEFGLGYPPRLLGLRRGETIYSLNLLPLGGFVRLLGEEDPSYPRSLASKSIKARLLVLSSGSLMNALLPLLLLTISFMIPRSVEMADVLIDQVAPGSPAALAELMPGDKVLRVSDQEVRSAADIIFQTRLHLGSPLSLLIERDGAQRTLSLVPRWMPPSGEGPLGVSLRSGERRVVRVSSPPWQAFGQSVGNMWDTLRLYGNEIRGWLKGRAAPQVGGPIAIVQISTEVARLGPSPLFAFAALLSLNLAIINLLPVPGLDGGRLAFVILEGVRGRRLSPTLERRFHIVGFLFLIVLIFLVSYFDLLRLLRNESLVP